MDDDLEVIGYPWAAPTPEQMAYFDALPRDEQLRQLRAAIAQGFEGEPGHRSMDQILADARQKAKSRQPVSG